MKIYENVIIGNFLYILGLYDGVRSPPSDSTPRAVSLLQQTPLDKSIADVLVQSPTSIFIIEFKRKGASEQKEDAKRKNLQKSLRKLPELQALSKEIHWYVRSDVVEKQLQLEVMPYLGKIQDIRLSNLEGLVRTITGRNPRPHDLRACQNYLRVLRTATAKAKAQGQASSSGTVVLLAAADSGFRHVILDDLTDIFKVHSQLVSPIAEALPTFSDDNDSTVIDEENVVSLPTLKPR